MADVPHHAPGGRGSAVLPPQNANHQFPPNQRQRRASFPIDARAMGPRETPRALQLPDFVFAVVLYAWLANMIRRVPIYWALSQLLGIVLYYLVYYPLRLIFRILRISTWVLAASVVLIPTAGYWAYAYVAVSEYTDSTEPYILSGWADSCPPTWLYSEPQAILTGIPARYYHIYPQASVYSKAYKKFLLCWGADKTYKHKGNALNITLSPVNVEKILLRGHEAYEYLSDCRGFPCVPRVNRLQRKNFIDVSQDGLPVHQNCQCKVRDAIWNLVSQIFRAVPPVYSPPVYPTTVEQLSDYCPCDLRKAWRQKLFMLENLPKPFRVHPFYTDKENSPLFAHNDPFTWFIYLYGNRFFMPFGRTHISQYSREELFDLNVLGWWDDGYPEPDRIQRPWSHQDVLKARGLSLTKRQKMRLEVACRFLKPYGSPDEEPLDERQFEDCRIWYRT